MPQQAIGGHDVRSGMASYRRKNFIAGRAILVLQWRDWTVAIDRLGGRKRNRPRQRDGHGIGLLIDGNSTPQKFAFYIKRAGMAIAQRQRLSGAHVFGGCTRATLVADLRI